MKPALCAICGLAAFNEKTGQKGDWIEFADYRESEVIVIGHPEGLVYFCARHVAAARNLRLLPSDQAIVRLRSDL
ncbi:MAG: hypothetical protein LBE62_02485 [Azonexus sp.]|jgi:hypothetical protein|nr:hypothetical protein [Azonexus sp.]